jgi:antitoxin component YwqK of YwqJK toxin-antitoxin module
MERFWWPNGKLKEEGHWFDGRANGVFKEWSSLGELEKVIRFKNGEIVEVILEKS